MQKVINYNKTDVIELTTEEAKSINGGLVKEFFMLFGVVIACMQNDYDRVQKGQEIQSVGQKSTNAAYS